MKPPVKYRIEPKKGKKETPPYNCLLLTNEDEIGTTNLDGYEKLPMEGGVPTGASGVFLSDDIGQGVYYADDAWFTSVSSLGRLGES